VGSPAIKSTRAPRQVVNSYQRDENRRVQTALNYFGFPAGPADGVIRPSSRAAVTQYQASLGFAPTGVLMEHEKLFLTSSYERALVGGPQAAQIMATSGQGTRGLLLAYRQEQLGVATVAAPVAPPVVAQPVVVPPAVVEAAAPPAVAPAAPEAAPAAPVVEVAAKAVVPSFMPAASEASLAGLCNRVTMAMSTNLGPITSFDLALDDPDPMQVLDEQFCLARSHAIDQANSLIAAVEGFTPKEMRTQCEAFAPTMARFTADLAGRPPSAVTAEVRDFLDGTGADPAQMSGTGRICLGIGYSTDNAELGLASALVLTALGEAAYGELVGFQVVNGYGVPADCDCGLNWTTEALDALRNGSRPLVADPDGEHVELVAYAVDALRAPDEDAPIAVNAAPADAGGFALPKAP
jgi:peptidoglycan hydrolase-like protein with peptidoglycan-binding domain